MGKFKDAPPFDGQHFQEVGVTTEMMRDFAERRGINLIVMHGNRKICHDTGGSEQFLAYVSWDSHAYFCGPRVPLRSGLSTRAAKMCECACRWIATSKP